MCVCHNELLKYNAIQYNLILWLNANGSPSSRQPGERYGSLDVGREWGNLRSTARSWTSATFREKRIDVSRF